MTVDWVGFSVSGPRSRELMNQLTGEDFSQEAHPFLRVRKMRVGPTEAWVLRVSFTGELGYEVYFPSEYQLEVLQFVVEQGQQFGLGLIGSRALLSLRLEKSYGSWGREYTPEFNPYESRLDRFVRFDKGDFIGKQSLQKLSQQEQKWLLTGFTIDVDDQDAVGGEPIICDGEVVGIVTSGAFGHTVGTSFAVGYVPPSHLNSKEVSIEIIGDAKQAQIVSEALVDPRGLRMRS